MLRLMAYSSELVGQALASEKEEGSVMIEL